MSSAQNAWEFGCGTPVPIVGFEPAGLGTIHGSAHTGKVWIKISSDPTHLWKLYSNNPKAHETAAWIRRAVKAYGCDQDVVCDLERATPMRGTMRLGTVYLSTQDQLAYRLHGDGWRGLLTLDALSYSTWLTAARAYVANKKPKDLKVGTHQAMLRIVSPGLDDYYAAQDVKRLYRFETIDRMKSWHEVPREEYLTAPRPEDDASWIAAVRAQLPGAVVLCGTVAAGVPGPDEEVGHFYARLGTRRVYRVTLDRNERGHFERRWTDITATLTDPAATATLTDPAATATYAILDVGESYDHKDAPLGTVVRGLKGLVPGLLAVKVSRQSSRGWRAYTEPLSEDLLARTAWIREQAIGHSGQDHDVFCDLDHEVERRSMGSYQRGAILIDSTNRMVFAMGNDGWELIKEEVPVPSTLRGLSASNVVMEIFSRGFDRASGAELDLASAPLGTIVRLSGNPTATSLWVRVSNRPDAIAWREYEAPLDEDVETSLAWIRRVAPGFAPGLVRCDFEPYTLTPPTTADEIYLNSHARLVLVARDGSWQPFSPTTLTPETPMPNEPTTTNSTPGALGRIAQTLQTDADDAAWRTAGSQFVKLAREPLVAVLARHLGPDDPSIRARIAAFLDTEIGTALFVAVLSAGLSTVPAAAGKVPARLARELRVRAMTDAGDVLADVLMGPLREVISRNIVGEATAAIEPPGVRVATAGEDGAPGDARDLEATAPHGRAAAKT